MNDMSRRVMLSASIAGLASVTLTENAAASSTSAVEYKNASVEHWESDTHAEVALRPGGGQVSHFAEWANAKGLMIAIAAGLNGCTVNFTTEGESGGFWRKCKITAVNKPKK